MGQLVGKIVLCLHNCPASLLKWPPSYTPLTSLPGLSTTCWSLWHVKVCLTSFLLGFYHPRWGTVILRDVIIPFLHSILHVCCRSIAQKAYLLPSCSSLLVTSAFRKWNLRLTSILALPLTLPPLQYCLIKHNHRSLSVPSYGSVTPKQPESF